MILGIYGAGGLGREILDLARSINTETEQWEKIAFIDDSKAETHVLNGADVLTFEEFKAGYTVRNAKVTIAVGEPKYRQLLREKIEREGYALQTLIQPTAFIGTGTEIEGGAIIHFGCWVSCDIRIGANALLQPNSIIGHDSVVGRDAVISPCVAVSGACNIGERAYIGIGVSIRDHTSIGADTIIGMGAVVVRDIPNDVVALGNPARAMKRNESGLVFQ